MVVLEEEKKEVFRLNSRREFLNEVFRFFNVKDEQKTAARAYDLALSVNYPVDWTAFYLDVVKTVDKKQLPVPKFFTDKIRNFKKKTAIETADDGKQVRVELKDGYYYDFTVSAGAANRIERFKNQQNVKKITVYPKTAALIGKSVSYEEPDDEKFTKTIFIAPGFEEEEEFEDEEEKQWRKWLKWLWT